MTSPAVIWSTLDMQVYLVVNSFAERDVYMYSSWYGRVANKAYQHDVSASQTDWERHFTVACYEDDPALSSQQVGHPCCSLFTQHEKPLRRFRGPTDPPVYQEYHHQAERVAEVKAAFSSPASLYIVT